VATDSAAEPSAHRALDRGVPRDGVSRCDRLRRGREIHYDGRIAEDGTIPPLDIHTSRVGGGARAQGFVSMIAGRDIVQVVEHAGRKVDTTRVAARPGTMLLFDPSIGLYEMIVARARSQKSHTAAVAVVKIDAESTPMAACAVSRADHGHRTLLGAAGVESSVWQEAMNG